MNACSTLSRSVGGGSIGTAGGGDALATRLTARIATGPAATRSSETTSSSMSASCATSSAAIAVVAGRPVREQSGARGRPIASRADGSSVKRDLVQRAGDRIAQARELRFGAGVDEVPGAGGLGVRLGARPIDGRFRQADELQLRRVAVRGR